MLDEGLACALVMRGAMARGIDKPVRHSAKERSPRHRSGGRDNHRGRHLDHSLQYAVRRPRGRQHRPPERGENAFLVRVIALWSMLFALWLLLSGHYTPLLIGFGAGSCALVVYLSHRMDVVDHEGMPLRVFARLVFYVPWLLKEILQANIVVARIILNPRLPISPIIVNFRAHQTTDLGRAIYANSITLTPGTITTGVAGEDLEIHALTFADVDGREEDEMDRRVVWVEGSG